MQEPAGLAPTVMADITGRDTDGELLATPTEWDAEENGPAPKIRIHVPRRPQPGTAAGVGDRALLRIETADETRGPPYHGRVIKVIDRARHATARNFPHVCPMAAGGWCRSTRNRPAAS